MGFQDLPKQIHIPASRKGGKVRTKKGFAMNSELAREAGAKGGKAKAENKSNGNTNVRKAPESNGRGFLEEVLGTLEDE